MFGHQDDPQQPQNTGYTDNQAMPMPDPAAAGMPVNPYAAVPAADPAAAQPLLEPQATDGYIAAPAVPAYGTPPAPDPAPQGTDMGPAIGDSADLLNLKQQAMQQLSPLVGHLDQSPEEKFRTTMMMIQASDNQTLLKDAYEAANQIPDEKTRAQALLDVINEINYFTQHQNAQ